MKRARFLGYLLAAGAALPMAMFSLFAYERYQEAVRDGRREAVHNAEILQKHADGILEAHRRVIQLVDLKLEGLGPMRWGDSALRDFLLAMEGEAEGASSVSLFDRDGNLVATSFASAGFSLNAADRGFFREAMASDGFVLGRRVIGRLSGEPLFFLARRREAGDGVIAVALQASFFEDVYRTAASAYGTDVGIGMVREDGVVLARYPPLDRNIVLGVETGFMRHATGRQAVVYRSVAQVDGEDRLYATRRLASFPVYVSYGVNMGAVLAPWYRNMLIDGGGALVVSVLLAGMSWLALRQARRDVYYEAWLRQQVAERTAEAERRAADAEAATRERQDALAVAERANASKSHFLAAASHDLRQPVQALRLFIDVLGSASDPRTRTAALSNASAALVGLEDLLSALLDISVLEAGTVTPNRERFEASVLLARLQEEFRDEARKKGLRLRVVPSRALLFTDPVLLHRIMANLVGNALKYTRKGGVVVGVRRGGDYARLEVWDSGIGIPADKTATIFDDFHQLSNPERDRRRGLGLGLGIVRRTADLLGLAITLHTQEGRGSVFSVTVPLDETARSQAA